MIEIRDGVNLEHLRVILAARRADDTEMLENAERFSSHVAEGLLDGIIGLDAGEPFVAAGITRIAANTGGAWLAANRDLMPYRKTVFQHVRDRLRRIASKERVITAVRSASPRNVRFLKHLGFVLVERGNNGTDTYVFNGDSNGS